MASMLSVISLFVLLLITYSYSIPVGVQYASSTPVYQFLSNGSTVQSGSLFYNGTAVYQVSTAASDVHQPRLLTDFSSEETTASVGMTVSPRSIGESSSEENTSAYGMTVSPRSIGESNSEEAWSSTPSEQDSNAFTSTTVESDTTFNQRAIHNSGNVGSIPSSAQSYSQGQKGTSQHVGPSSSFTKSYQNSNWIPNGQSRPQFSQREDQEDLSLIESSADPKCPGTGLRSKRDGRCVPFGGKRSDQEDLSLIELSSKICPPGMIMSITTGKCIRGKKRSDQEDLSLIESMISLCPTGMTKSSKTGRCEPIPRKRSDQEDLSFIESSGGPRNSGPNPQTKHSKRAFFTPENRTALNSQVYVLPSSSQQSVTDEAIYTSTVDAFPITTVGGFTGNQTTVPQNV